MKFNFGVGKNILYTIWLTSSLIKIMYFEIIEFYFFPINYLKNIGFLQN